MLWAATALVCIPIASGCHLNDPNHNPKIRYQLAIIHANEFLKESGSSLRCHYPSYDLEMFSRFWYDEETETEHPLVLYDYLKTTNESGPRRFVIAYDKFDRRTYLRTDLRSNQNLAGWEEFKKHQIEQSE